MKNRSPAKLVRSLMTITGQGWRMFNDKTRFGRSIKVWGVKDDFYKAAQEILMKHGYTVKIISTPKVGSGMCQHGGNLRLHVYL